jgi:hypothetical protein
MKIVLAEHFGMCFGVRDAIAQAEELAEQAPLTILGELVHNPIVRERLRATRRDRGLTRSTGSDIRAGDDYRTWSIGRKACSVARARITCRRWNVSSRSARA